MLALATLFSLAGLAAALNHEVQVAPGGALIYQPPNIVAAVGDSVSFIFTSKNFTVTQSSFAAPCVAKKGGIDSGFVAIAANATTAKTFTLNVVDNKPALFFSAQGRDCEVGMIFTLNPAGSQAQASANASTTKTQASATASATAAGRNHNVQVAPGGALIYQPPSIVAAAGDTVSFIFTNKNFTVTQSSFAAPCVAKKGGRNTGFIAVSPNATEATTFTLAVTDTQPAIFFSAQGQDCEHGMIFTLNPPKKVARVVRRADAGAAAALAGRKNGAGLIVRNAVGALAVAGTLAALLL